MEACRRDGGNTLNRQFSKLKVVSWNVVGLTGDQAESFVTHISILMQWDVLLLQECFKKLEGVNVGVHELCTPKELSGEWRCPAIVVHERWKGQARASGGTCGWVVIEVGDCLTTISKVLREFEEWKSVGERWRLQHELLWDDLFPPHWSVRCTQLWRT